jgi:hypothetical protein
MVAGKKDILAKAKKQLDARKCGDETTPYRLRRPWKSNRAVDPDEVFRMAKIGQNDTQIAKYLGISNDTLTRHFKEILARGRIEGENELWTSQYDKANGKKKEGDTQLLIHLGKCRLKQTDSQETTTSKCMAESIFEQLDRAAEDLDKEKS